MELNFLLIISIVICAVVAYLIGSINFAIIITKLVKHQDIRKLGSGNAGATNVLRTVGKLPALFTLLGDFSKGIISVVIARLVFMLFCGVTGFYIGDYIVAFAALLGHVFPIYYGFKGGKGILVSAGAVFILSPLALAIDLSMFIIVTAITKYVSLGSITAAVLLPLAILAASAIYGGIVLGEVLMAVPIGALILYMHRKNVVRLIKGTESKISFKSKKQ
ncbi:MAG: glycerol-3-phosphate 1-O-acyltransferase PlsY [Oscillospiraceae bacterium]